uniref:Coluporin-3 n=1 Tax=Colubraria reticulata TaxID=604273 RepID=A0A499RKC5_9CAEN|nr:coluporin-3 [Colubraria reticulata]
MVLQFPSLKTLLMTFLFVIGHGPPPVWMTDFKAVQAAARTAVTPGQSFEQLRKKNAENHWQYGYWVKVVMTIENWSRFPLNSWNNIVESGAFFGGANAINPGKKEKLEFRNGDLVGSYGTVSFLIDGADRRFVIMYSAPYLIAYIGHRNWLGLGLTSKGFTDIREEHGYYYTMYNEWDTWDLKWARKVFYSRKDPVMYSDNQFVLWGTMANTRKADITIVFRPVNNNDLASEIKAKL